MDLVTALDRDLRKRGKNAVGRKRCEEGGGAEGGGQQAVSGRQQAVGRAS